MNCRSDNTHKSPLIKMAWDFPTGEPRTKIFKKMAWGPPKFHTRPFRSGMDIKGNPAPRKFLKKGVTLIRVCSLAGRRKRGGDKRAPPPEPYQATCLQHWEGVLGGPPKAPCPHVDEDKGLIPTTLARWLWGSAGGGLIGIWKPSLTRGPLDTFVPPYHFTLGGQDLGVPLLKGASRFR
ncbi:hypothetical protein AB205_0049350 [Aquarana catesbeiana]|uniref:Uncharacterized protein n=1 Tax=Aquarana catesbeiana TaxID=8400 RepID=A0A2G9QGK0_AQUCT|nr:hypothetical protein AB205_0049350 [Aquarana catesbeiana]